MSTSTDQVIVSLRWNANHLELLDQRLLPEEILYLNLTKVTEVWEAIRQLKVRGAPAIGITAAYGVYFAAQRFIEQNPLAATSEVVEEVKRQAEYLATSRPTAVNLFWALDRMKLRSEALSSTIPASLSAGLLIEAQQIHAEDEETCRMIGEHALSLFESGMGVLTHCNAGGLATAKYGTALAPFYLALEKGIDLKVFADETRPV